MWFTPVTPKSRGFGTKDSELKAQVKAKMSIKILQLTDVVHACTAEAGGAAGNCDLYLANALLVLPFINSSLVYFVFVVKVHTDSDPY